MAFLGACFVRRFSLNALSVPPLGQVQARFGDSSSLLAGGWASWWLLGRSWAFLGRFGALVGVLGCFLGTLGTFLVALGLSGAPSG